VLWYIKRVNYSLRVFFIRRKNDFLENHYYTYLLTKTGEQVSGKYGFLDNQDFTIHKIVIGNNTQIDYYLSLDMAKELSIVENNEKGMQERKYFI